MKTLIDEKTLQTYGLPETLTTLQEYVKQGYEVDVETNATFPIIIGTMMMFTVKKYAEDEANQQPEKEAQNDGVSGSDDSSVDEDTTKQIEEIVQEQVKDAVEAVQTVLASKRGPKPKASQG